MRVTGKRVRVLEGALREEVQARKNPAERHMLSLPGDPLYSAQVSSLMLRSCISPRRPLWDIPDGVHLLDSTNQPLPIWNSPQDYAERCNITSQPQDDWSCWLSMRTSSSKSTSEINHHGAGRFIAPLSGVLRTDSGRYWLTVAVQKCSPSWMSHIGLYGLLLILHAEPPRCPIVSARALP